MGAPATSAEGDCRKQMLMPVSGKKQAKDVAARKSAATSKKSAWRICL
jgi:hypothetical protein